MRVAIAPLAETMIDIDLESDSISVTTIYVRLPRTREEVRAVYPSARLVGDVEASFIERSLWDLILVGGLAAPALSSILDAPSFRPLEGLQWRTAAYSFSMLRTLYRRGRLTVEALERLPKIILEALTDYARVARQLERLECEATGLDNALAVGDDALSMYAALGRRLSRDEFLDVHILVVRSGLVEKRIKPLEYSVPQRPSRLEYALLVYGESVETGPYARLRHLNGFEVDACGSRLIIEDGGVRGRIDGEEFSLGMPATPLASRLYSMYVDALVASILSCRHGEVNPGERRLFVREVVDGPVIDWGRLVTLPSLYNLHSSGMAGSEPPLARLLRAVLCLDVARAGWLALAVSSIYTGCCRLALRVSSRGKTFVQKRDAPRVTA